MSETAGRSSRGRCAAALIIAGGLGAVTGCVQMPFTDHSYERTIPAAISEADLGIVDAAAASGVDGFSSWLFIGGTVADDELSDDELRRVIRIAVQDVTFPCAYLRLGFSSTDGEQYDTSAAVERLVGRHRATDVIRWNDMVRIAYDGRGRP